MLERIDILRATAIKPLEIKGELNLDAALVAADLHAGDWIRREGEWIPALDLAPDLPEHAPVAVPKPWLLLAVLVGAGLFLIVGIGYGGSGNASVPTPIAWGGPTPAVDAPQSKAEMPPVPALSAAPCSGKACALQAAHPTWPLSICTAVADERVALGMTGAQALASWGKPVRKEGDKWCYEADCAVGLRLVQDRVVDRFGP